MVDRGKPSQVSKVKSVSDPSNLTDSSNRVDKKVLVIDEEVAPNYINFLYAKREDSKKMNNRRVIEQKGMNTIMSVV